jgi:hypothetical protein
MTLQHLCIILYDISSSIFVSYISVCFSSIDEQFQNVQNICNSSNTSRQFNCRYIYVNTVLPLNYQDPKRNRIEQFLGVKPVPYSVFAGDLQLSPVTTHGLWRIEVKQLVS